MFFIDKTAQAVQQRYRKIAIVRWATPDEQKRAFELGYQYCRLCEATPFEGLEDEFARATYNFLHLTEDAPSIEIPKEFNSAEWNERVTTWLSGQSNLLGCVKEFRWAHPELRDPRFATSVCYPTSGEFLRLLLRRGVITQAMINRKEAWVDSWETEAHWYSRIGNIVIDWTYRQFDPTCAFPYIWRASPALRA
jgi:hypothetical protein